MKNAEIDWSKAPGWATVRLQHVHDSRLFAWGERYLSNTKFMRDDVAPVVYPRIDTSYWAVIGERPQEWTDKGLPPVNCECEMTHESWGHRGWERVTIKYISADYAITTDAGGEQHWHMRNVHFRPLRTAEQLAAEARDKAIESMRAACPYPGSAGTYVDCEALYDAGYRKTKTCNPVESDEWL